MQNEQNGEAEIWNQIGFIISSKYRLAAVEQIVEDPSTPSVIASETDLPVTHISRALRTLSECSIAELRVPTETKKGRIYGTTTLGSQLWRRIEMEGMAD